MLIYRGLLIVILSAAQTVMFGGIIRKETQLKTVIDSSEHMIKRGAYDETVNLLEKQHILIAQFRKPNNLVSDYYRIFAKAYSIRQNLDLALQNFILSRSYCDTINGKTQLIKNLFEEGEYYRKIADHKTAREKFDKAFYYEQKSPVYNAYNIARYYNRMAAVYTETVKNDSSLLFSNICVEIAEKHRFYDLLNLSYNEIAYIVQNLHTEEVYQKSIAYYDKAMDAAKISGNDMDWATTALNKCRLLGTLKKFAEEKKLLEECYIIGKKNNWLDILARYYLDASAVAENLHQPLVQAKLQVQFYQTQQLIDAKTRSNRMHEIQKIYDQEKNLAIIDEQNKTIEQEKRATEQKHRQQLWVIVISVVLFILLIIIAFFAFKFSRATKGLTVEQQKLNNANTNLQQALSKNELLVREIHHRVKNNLQIISSLLDIQQRKENNPAVSGAFKDARTRITSMSLVHQNLYEQENPVELNTTDYFNRLFRLISASYKSTASNIEYKINSNNVQLNIDTLIPLALLVNEWITNSYKYAFDGRSNGQIYFELSNSSEGYTCIYRDNGNGINEDKEVKKGLGTLMIEQLSRQLFGTVQKNNSVSGLEYIFKFKGI